MKYPCPHCSTVPQNRGTLRKHVMGGAAYGGHELTSAEADAIVARIESGSSAPNPRLPSPSTPLLIRRAGAAVREKHERSVRLLEETQAVHAVLAEYERAIGHPVYLRPTAN